MKKLLSLGLLTLIFTVVFLQTSNLKEVSAQVLTPPSTGIGISGHIDYKNLFRLFGGIQRFVPAAGVTVTFTKFFDKSTSFQTTTDSSGNYFMQLDPALYKVTVSDSEDTFFSPHIKSVNLKTSTKTADFTGLVFKP